MRSLTLAPLLAAALLTACSGSKITTDLPDDTGTPSGDGGSDDGGSSGDGGTADGGGTDGGSTETDADGDGWTVSDGDCNDDDATVYPTAPDDCYDGVDSNCTGDDDYDCDDDGYASDDYDGDDCDDTDPDINPGAGDGSPDGVDQDCDGEIDEDVCNVYAMLGQTDGYKNYATVFFDGGTYTEQVEHRDFDASTGSATVWRSLSGGSLAMEIEEAWTCAEDGTVSVTGYTSSTSGFDVAAVSFSSPSTRLLPQDDMVPGASWSMDYSASDATLGALWDLTADLSVTGTQELTVAAGTFDTVVVEASYVILDQSTYVGDRSGTVVYYYTPGIGLVYSLDTLDDGTVSEERELTTYGGFEALESDGGDGGADGDGGSSDGGSSDGGSSDGGSSDGGSSDGGSSDGGSSDGGSSDGGSSDGGAR